LVLLVVWVVLLLKNLKKKKKKVIGIDIKENKDADYSIVIKAEGTFQESQYIIEEIKKITNKISSIIVVSGGFSMGSIKNENIFEVTEKMLQVNLKSALTASHIASHLLEKEGLLVITGAAGVLNNPTPAFLGYGISKAATHHLVSSLSQPNSGLPEKTTVVCILPVILDTPQNRKDMPNSNFDNWTPLETVAEALLNWCDGKNRPKNGSFIKIKTENKKTEFISL
jgi:dihydropteridine reductase